MIITLIVIAICVTGVILCVVDDHNYKSSGTLGIIGIVTAILSFFVILGIGAGIFTTQINKDIDYQNKLYEKEMIEYRIDKVNESIVGNEMLYNDIVEFNNDLREVKKWANNLWTNWFWNEKIASIDFVTLEKGVSHND